VSAEGNKTIVRRMYSADNEGDLEGASAFVSPALRRNGETVGREDDLRRDHVLHTAFPDLRYEIEELVAEGDKVVSRWRMTGTHSGVLESPAMTLPATGRTLDLWGVSIYRIEAGMVVEIWESFDMMEFLRQLGVA
jgi:predicted ester cyclase